jgi:hypothetical protein
MLLVTFYLPEIFFGRSRFVVRFSFFFKVFLTATASFGAATVGGVARPLDFCGSG